MLTEYFKELVNSNIRDGANIIYVKYIGLDNFLYIPVDCFIGIEFGFLSYLCKGKTMIEKNYIAIDKIVHISFEKRIEVEESID